MNPEIKKKWLEALRSGKYEQTTGKLCEKNGDFEGYCCLGVLTDLYVKEGLGKWEQRIFTSGHKSPECFLSGDFSFGPNVSQLAEEVRNWAGLEDTNPTISTVQVDGVHRYLSELNDEGESFSTIADLIEERL